MYVCRHTTKHLMVTAKLFTMPSTSPGADFMVSSRSLSVAVKWKYRVKRGANILKTYVLLFCEAVWWLRDMKLVQVNRELLVAVASRNDDVIKWKPFRVTGPFLMGIHRCRVDSPHKDQWRGASVFSLIRSWTDRGSNNRDAGDLRRHRALYDVTVMCFHSRL